MMDLGSDLVSGIGNTLPSMNRQLLIHSQLAPRRLPRMFYSKMKVMKEYKYSDALIDSNLRQMAQQKNVLQRGSDGEPQSTHSSSDSAIVAAHSLCFEGSFETEPNHQAQLWLILGDGLLLCKWNPAKLHRLKFVAFYPWSSFFSVSNRPGNRVLIATFKGFTIQRANDSTHKSEHRLSPSTNDPVQPTKSPPPRTPTQQTTSFYRHQQSQSELRLPLKSPSLAHKIANKLALHIRAQHRL